MAKKVNVSKINDENEMLKLLKLIILVGLIVLVFYIITLFVNNKDKDEDVTQTPATIQYDYILVGNILNQPNDTYYVLSKTIDDTDVKTYEAYLSNYKSLDDALRVYYVDLDNPLNSKFLKESSSFKISNIADISFKETTLLLIEDNKIKKTYEGKDNIIEILSQITKTDKE